MQFYIRRRFCQEIVYIYWNKDSGNRKFSIFDLAVLLCGLVYVVLIVDIEFTFGWFDIIVPLGSEFKEFVDHWTSDRHSKKIKSQI